MNIKNLEWLKNTKLAHRGLHNTKQNIPENSMLAFKKAIDKGYGIECDVRISKDNIIYVFHDKNTKRLCSKDLRFEKLISNEISKLRIQNTNEYIPTFDEFLSLVNNQVPILIEIKPTNRYHKLNKILVEKLKKYKGDYAIQSYSPVISNWFKTHFSEAPRGIIAESYGHPYQPFYLIWLIGNLPLWTKIVKPDFYNYNIKDLPNQNMINFKEQGGIVISFTARSQKDLDYVKSNYHNAVFEGFIPSEK